jgi:AraC-like DNA-binding protein
MPFEGASLSPAWSGRVVIGRRQGAYVGAAGRTSVHAVHAVKVALALDAPFKLRIGDGSWFSARSSVVPPETPHALDGDGALVALFYLQPARAESGPVCAARLPLPFEKRLPGAIRRWLETASTCAELDEFAGEIAGALPDVLVGPPRDPRVVSVIDLLGSDAGPVSLDVAARSIGLSATRLTHQFRQQTGSSFKHYGAWIRLQRAIERMTLDLPLTRVAHEAGFADAAHFTRTFRAMLGITPSHLARHSRFFTSGA